MPTYPVTDKKTGKSYKMKWDMDEPPSKLDVRQFIWEQENRGIGGKIKDAFNWANTPLADINPLRSKDPRIRQGAEIINKEHPTLGAIGSFTSDVASSLSSPLSLGLGGTTAVGQTAMRFGAPAARGITRAAGAGMVGHGAYNMATGEDTATKVGGGVEALGGAFGMRLPKINVAPETAQRFGRSQGNVRTPRQRQTTGFGLPQKRIGGQVDPNVPIEGEVMTPLREPGGLPDINNRGLPPARPTYYGGSRGVSTNIDEAFQNTPETFTGGPGEMRARPQNWSAAQATLREPPAPMSRVPSPPPGRDILEQNTPYGVQYQRRGTTPLEDFPEARPTAPKAAAPKAPAKPGIRVYEATDDASVAYLAEQGDQAAIAEAALRPTLKEKLKHLFTSESGFVRMPSRRPSADAPKAAPEQPYIKGFADWVNKIHASKVEGTLKRKEFADLDDLGIDAIHAFQAGSRTGRLKDVADYLDDKFKTLEKTGVRVGYRENYLPQIWADDPAKVQEVYRRLGLKPGFTLKRIFSDYAAGMRAGLTPKFENVGDLVGWYEQKSNKAIYDREFYNQAKEQGWIKPKGKGGPDWLDLDSNHFPAAHFKVKGTNETRTVPMTAPRELHKMIDNYLKTPQEHIEKAANVSSTSKNLAMSAGVPMTGVNAHGFNILARTLIGNPKQALKAGRYLVNYTHATKELDKMLPTAPWAVKRGLMLSSEGHEMGVSGSTNLVSQGLTKFFKVQGKLFEDPLFQNIIPALKLKHFNDMTTDLIKTGIPREQAGTQAARFTNDLYGGYNFEELGKSRDWQNIGRMLILAPDWLGSNVRLGKGMAKTLMDPSTPQGKYYAKMARNIIATYAGADVIQYGMHGKHMWENPPGHALDIDLGETKEDKDRWLRPFGTAADFIRLPFDIASSALKFKPSGKWEPDFGSASTIAKNRMSIPGSTVSNFLTKRDDFGRPFLGKDDYGRMIPWEKQVGGSLSELSDLVLPPYVKSGVDYATGRAGLEQSLLGAVESPIRYSAKPRPKSRNRASRKRRQ